MTRKKADTMRECLMRLMEEQGAREQILRSVLDKATAGDMRAIEYIREILGEDWSGSAEDRTLTVKLGKGVEELCK